MTIEEQAELFRQHLEQLGYVKVIICEDCKYSVDEYDDGECYCDFDKALNYIGKDWNHYCSWAERKEE